MALLPAGKHEILRVQSTFDHLFIPNLSFTVLYLVSPVACNAAKGVQEIGENIK